MAGIGADWGGCQEATEAAGDDGIPLRGGVKGVPPVIGGGGDGAGVGAGRGSRRDAVEKVGDEGAARPACSCCTFVSRDDAMGKALGG